MHRTSRRRCRYYGVVLAIFAVLSVVMTWPLVDRLSDTVLGPPMPGDSFQYVFLIRWLKESVWDATFPFTLYEPRVFHPFGYNLALSETTLAQTVFALPLSTAFGEVVAYNLVLLSTFVLSGLAAYLLARYHTGSHAAAMLGGLIYAFSPYRLSHLGAGHLPLMATQWLPLSLLYLDMTIQKRATSSALLAALFYALGALSSWYYAYIFALAGGAYVLLRGRPWRTVLFRRSLGKRLVVFLLACLILVGPIALSVRDLWSEGGRPQSLHYLDQFSASPLDFVYPNVMQPAWGAWFLTRYRQDIAENVLFLGFVPLALAIWSLRRKPDATRSAFAWLGLTFAVLAMGTTLHWMNAPVYVAVPNWVERVFTAGMGVLTKRLALNPISSYDLRVAGAVYLPLPTLLLYLYLPFFGAMRVWSRLGLVSVLSVAVLAGYGWLRLREYIGRSWLGAHRGQLAAVSSLALYAAVMIEFAAFPYAMGTSRVEARPVDLWLARSGGSYAIMEFPVTKALSGRPLYAMYTHGKKIAFGYGTFFPRAFQTERSVLESFPSEECIVLLKDWGVRYVLVGELGYGRAWSGVERELSAATGLHHVVTLDDRPIYEGDRLLHLLPGTESAFVVDRIRVYEVL